MAHYYAQALGARGIGSIVGHKNTGITATANSWIVGAEIDINWSDTLNTDIVTIYSTRGSNSNRRHRIMSYAIIDGTMKIIDTEYPELLI